MTAAAPETPDFPRRGEAARAASAGLVTAVVGFTSSFVVVLTGLRAVGATEAQASSGLLTLCLAVGLTTLFLALRHRIPSTTAWSTPGAAMLGSAGAAVGGFSDAVGSFLVCAVLLVLSGAWPVLGGLAARIPASIAQAMLAGVLFPLCLQPVLGLSRNPLAVAPVLVVWLLAYRWVPRWAVPLAFLAAGVVVGIGMTAEGTAPGLRSLLPTAELVAPTFSLQALVGVGIPLYVVTMASQNLPGAAVLRSFGYTAPWRPALVSTGLGSLAVAPFGGNAVNLAAITTALAASPETGVAPGRRWVSSVWCGASYLVLALFSAAIVAVAAAAPAGVLAAVAGVALFGAFSGAVQGAWSDEESRIPVVATFLVAASGTAFLGISAAFWALVAGIVLRAVLVRRR